MDYDTTKRIGAPFSIKSTVTEADRCRKEHICHTYNKQQYHNKISCSKEMEASNR
jgi:hypothetical protein